MTETATGSTLWDTLERWCANVFLAAGTLLLIAAVLEVLDTYIAASTQGIGGIAGFSGTVLVFVGLLGLYPRLAEGALRLAQAGLLLLVLPVIYVSVLLIWALLAEFLPLPSLTAMTPAGELVLPGVFLLFGVGTALLGIVSLQTTTPSRAIGMFLLVLATAWFVFLGTALVYESIPEWAVTVITLIQVVAVLPIGYLLRTKSEQVDRAEPAPTEARHD